MKIINRATNETLAEIVGGESLTIEEACSLANIKIMRSAEDWQNGEGYDVNDLEMVF